MASDHEQKIDGSGQAAQQGNHNQQHQTIHYNNCPPGRCWQQGKLKWPKKYETAEFLLLAGMAAGLLYWLSS